MIALLQDFEKDYNFTVRIIDVDRDEHLRQKFNVLVPALYLGDREICHHFLDLNALISALDGDEMAPGAQVAEPPSA